MDKTEKTITFDNLPQAVIGISLTTLSLLKTGKGCAIRFSTLNKLCKVQECVPGDILDCSDLYISCFVFAFLSASPTVSGLAKVLSGMRG